MKNRKLSSKAVISLILSAVLFTMPAVAFSVNGNYAISAFAEETKETDDGQYHFTEDDLSSVARWRELYLPNGYEDLEQYDDTWWDQLYDYERDLAEYLKDLNVELSDQVYMDQSLDECIAIMESGVPPETFLSSGNRYRHMRYPEGIWSVR